MATATKKTRPGMLEKLSEREKMQLAGLGLFLMVMASVVSVGLFQRAMGDIEAATNRYESALDYLATAAPAYAERAAEESAAGTHKRIDDESLRKNNLQLTSFVAEQAKAANIEVTSYDEDELPFGNKKDGGPIVVEKQLRAEIRIAQMSALMDLLDRIHKSSEPVFVKRLDIRAQRKKPGEVRAVITFSTYVKKDAEAAP